MTKPIIEQEPLRELLRREMGEAVSELQPLTGGHFSRAFGFVADGRRWVVRFNASVDGFERDEYAGRRFAAPDLPIPRVLATGHVGDLHFAISERAAGITLDQLPAADARRLFPVVLDVLDRLHAVAVRATEGFGTWEPVGVGRFPTWRDYVLAIVDDTSEGYDRGWATLFRDSILERDLFQAIWARLQELVRFCPEERWLLHGDYGFDNLLMDGSRVSGVIDWASAGYGDLLYDVAWLGFWSASAEVDAILRRRYDNPDRVPAYAQRLACYQCRISLDALGFFARTEQRDAYAWTRDRARAVAGLAGDG